MKLSIFSFENSAHQRCVMEVLRCESSVARDGAHERSDIGLLVLHRRMNAEDPVC